MNENQQIINLIRQQRKQLCDLLNNSRGKFDQRKLDTIEAEIEGLDVRLSKYMEAN